MTSKPVAQLLVDLGVDRSHSRPHVSNDNPYSEANFKTLKYCPAFPGRFGSIDDARAFCTVFFDYYYPTPQRAGPAHRGVGALRHRHRSAGHSVPPPSTPTPPGSGTNGPNRPNCPPSHGSTNRRPKHASNPREDLSQSP
jgi:putative transposase